jgi:hypothetical protein
VSPPGAGLGVTVGVGVLGGTVPVAFGTMVPVTMAVALTTADAIAVALGTAEPEASADPMGIAEDDAPGAPATPFSDPHAVATAASAMRSANPRIPLTTRSPARGSVGPGAGAYPRR